MRRWTESNSLIFESDDGFKISINPENYTHELWTPTGYLIGFWRFSYIHEHSSNSYEYRCYLLYICEHQIDIVGDTVTHAARTALDKIVCTCNYSNKPKYKDLHINSCGKCRHLISKNYHRMQGFCDLVRINRNFEDRCVYEED